jgi:hypothetical protein
MEIVFGLFRLLSEGIPGIVVAGLAMILMLFALIREEPTMMTAAAILTIPLTFVAGGWSGFPLFVRLIPLFQLASAYFISRNDPVFAWILPMPSIGYLIFFLFNLVINDLARV